MKKPKLDLREKRVVNRLRRTARVMLGGRMRRGTAGWIACYCCALR